MRGAKIQDVLRLPEVVSRRIAIKTLTATVNNANHIANCGRHIGKAQHDGFDGGEMPYARV
jgi:hypothetical protein